MSENNNAINVASSAPPILLGLQLMVAVEKGPALLEIGSSVISATQ